MVSTGRSDFPVADRTNEFKGSYSEIREIEFEKNGAMETREVELEYNIWFKFAE